jgi:hypothetical protein
LLPPAAVYREIEADVDQWIKLSSIGFLINFDAMVAAGSTHFVSLGCLLSSVIAGAVKHGCLEWVGVACMSFCHRCNMNE